MVNLAQNLLAFGLRDRLQEKFGAEIRTVIDYREKR